MGRSRKQELRNQVIVIDGQPKVVQQIDRMAAIDKAEMYIVRKLPRYLKKLHELAIGITAVRNTKDGQQVYEIPPDRIALEYLVDRGLGRTPQRHEVTGQAGGPLEVLPWMPAGMLKQPEMEAIEGHATELQDIPISEADDISQTIEAQPEGEG